MSEATVTLTAREYAEILLTLTLRDRFAMAALTGILANDNSLPLQAKRAYELADAMLEARKEKK